MTPRGLIPVLAAGFAVFGGLLVATPAAAQSTSAKQKQAQPRVPPAREEVPNRLLPPPGMCRVWVNNVPARQQPAPTDCANAIRNRPPNGRVIFSEEAAPDPRRRAQPKNEERTRERPPDRPQPPAKTKPPT